MIELDKENPLVSVVVITYNSADTVIETLESIKSQSYGNIEVIITDDNSKDSTMIVARNWLKLNRDRFNKVVLLESENNTGVAGNINRGIIATSGEWIKPIAGDDLLKEDCIQENIEYMKIHEGVECFFSRCRGFTKGNDGTLTYNSVILPANHNISLFEMTAKEQNRKLLYYNFVPAVTFFISRRLAVDNLFSENYPFCEDWPQWFHLTKTGVRLGYFPSETVLYRVSESLSHTRFSFVNVNYYSSIKRFFFSERYKPLMDIDSKEALKQKKYYDLMDFAINRLNNRYSLINRIVLKLVIFFI